LAANKNKPRTSGNKTAAKRAFSSRITAGLDLLPSIDGRSTPARVVRDTFHAMLAHCGGAEHISEARRLLARRVACLESELINLECKFASIRAEGGTPGAKSLELYGRLSAHQRRCLEALGLDPTMRDVTPPPDPLAYAARYRREAEDAEAEA
jgi:hypothetical protein